MQKLKMSRITPKFNLFLAAIYVILSIAAAPMVLAANDNPICKKTATNVAIQKCVTSNPIVQDIQKIVDFLSAGVGIIVVAVIIVGGIQYSIAGDNAQKVTDAKKRITNALLALVVFIFMFGFLQWLIPGGIFK